MLARLSVLQEPKCFHARVGLRLLRCGLGVLVGLFRVEIGKYSHVRRHLPDEAVARAARSASMRPRPELLIEGEHVLRTNFTSQDLLVSFHVRQSFDDPKIFSMDVKYIALSLDQVAVRDGLHADARLGGHADDFCWAHRTLPHFGEGDPIVTDQVVDVLSILSMLENIDVV